MERALQMLWIRRERLLRRVCWCPRQDQSIRPRRTVWAPASDALLPQRTVSAALAKEGEEAALDVGVVPRAALRGGVGPLELPAASIGPRAGAG